MFIESTQGEIDRLKDQRQETLDRLAKLRLPDPSDVVAERAWDFTKSVAEIEIHLSLLQVYQENFTQVKLWRLQKWAYRTLQCRSDSMSGRDNDFVRVQRDAKSAILDKIIKFHEDNANQKQG